MSSKVQVRTAKGIAEPVFIRLTSLQSLDAEMTWHSARIVKRSQPTRLYGAGLCTTQVRV